MAEDTLVLHIEVRGFNVDGVADLVDSLTSDGFEASVFDIVTEEWMRPDVGLTLVSLPGEKCQNSDFEVHAMNGRIVGAHIANDARGDAAAPLPAAPDNTPAGRAYGSAGDDT